MRGCCALSSFSCCLDAFTASRTVAEASHAWSSRTRDGAPDLSARRRARLMASPISPACGAWTPVRPCSTSLVN